jgi:hypothetical protein
MPNKIRPITLALISALAITLAYTSCKKSETAESKSIDKKDLSLKLVKNFYNSFTANLSGGQKSSSLSKLRVNSPNNCDIPYTKQVNDSIIVTADETSYTAKGFITTTTLCDNNQWTALGYKLVDSISSVGLTITSETRMIVKENYTALTPTVGVYGTVKCNGTQWSHIVNTAKYANPVQIVDQTNNFTLKDVVVTANDGNGAARIQSGSALFAISGTVNAPSSTYSYTGTITFVGNNLVNVNFGAEVYVVNLNTGSVTQQ